MAGEAASQSLSPFTPSFIANNLQYHKDTVVFTDQSKLIFYNLASQTMLAQPPVSYVKSFRFVSINLITYLVVCSSNGTQIFNADGTMMITFLPIKDGVENAQYHKGISIAGDRLLAIGAHDGSIRALDSTDAKFNVAAVTKSEVSQPVGELNYCAMAEILVCAHDEGAITFWDAKSTRPLGSPFQLVETQMLDGQVEAPTASAVVGIYCFISFGNGSIRGFNCITRNLECLIAAHARWITAMDCMPVDNCFCSVGEDTVLNVWKVRDPMGMEPLEVSVDMSRHIVGHLLTGACFRESKSSLAVVAYDSEKVYLVN